ncbi:MAG: PDZ domain-containing protein [Candidatus Hydrogenedentes bacterium]|nr:PDZ domain-containing protein [Candidatus Hydrogenedentota bacterium]
MRNSGAILLAWMVAAAAIAPGSPAAAQDADARSAPYDAVSSAVCLLSYSSEITNPANGSVSKRETRALGLVVAPDGLVMTHGHMKLEDSEPFNIRVTVGWDEDEQEYDGVLLSKPDDVNVCFVRIKHEEPLDLPCIAFARGVELALGEPVVVIGVMGQSLDYRPILFQRAVGAILESPRTTYCIDDRVPFGAVGGPVLDGQRRVVGVVGFDLSPKEGGDLYIHHGHPLIFQADLFAKYIDTPPGEEETPEDREDAWLGVFTQPLTDDFAEYWNLPKRGGVIVSALVPDSPAEAAGLQRGDIIVGFNDTPVRAKQDREVLGFTKMVRDAGVGTEAVLKLLRNGEPVELRITLEGRPKSARDAGEYEDTMFGLTVREITTDLRIMLNLSADVQGVIVRRVKSGSWADLAGFRTGVIILNFGGHPTTTLDEFRQAVEQVADERPSEVTVFCRIGARTGFFRIQPRWQDAGEDEPAP